MKKIAKKSKLPFIIMSFLSGIGIGVGYHKMYYPTAAWHGTHAADTNSINVCFTPPSGCGSLIAREIAKAKETIHVQAFGLTSQKIVDQLVQAKQNGVRVRVLLDRSNLKDRYSKIQELKRAGIEVAIRYLVLLIIKL
ncbi:MAG: phospholipase D-like domain-containing protein [Candidatus Rickettsia vulgarisii]